MAKSLVKKIEENFLSCAICFEQLRDPIGLPCLHGFCTECLENWYKTSKDKTRVICPVCKTSAPLPKEGIRGFPGHFLVKNLRETVDIERMSIQDSCITVGKKVHIKASVTLTVLRGDVTHESVGKVTCVSGAEVKIAFPEDPEWCGLLSEIELEPTKNPRTSCDLCSEVAEVHCLDCKEYLCTQCHSNHNAFNALQGHETAAAFDVQSGKVTSKGRHCETHGQLIRYYCESENKQVCHDCVSLKKCPFYHSRLSLAEAASKQLTTLSKLVTECGQRKVTFQRSLSKTAEVEKSLAISKQQKSDALETIWKKKKLELQIENDKHAAVIIKARETIESKLKEIQEACDLVSKVIEHGSDYAMTYDFKTMVTTLENIIKLPEPVAVKMCHGHLKFDPGKALGSLYLDESTPMATNVSSNKLSLGCGSWNYWRQINTRTPNLRNILCSSCSDIAVSSEGDGVTVFSRYGNAYTLHCAPNNVPDIAATSDNRYIIVGKTKLLCYNQRGKQLSTITTPSPATTVAVDTHGSIIAGLSTDQISIHNADGTLESLFDTDSKPYFLSVISNHTLVVSFWDFTLKLMDYSGYIMKTIQPHPLVSDWEPGSTCCSPNGIIFVVNEVGNPPHIYGYTSEGDYLGLVTTDVTSPRGIALSTDGELLYVAERAGTIAIFEKQ